MSAQIYRIPLGRGGPTAVLQLPVPITRRAIKSVHGYLNLMSEMFNDVPEAELLESEGYAVPCLGSE